MSADAPMSDEEIPRISTNADGHSGQAVISDAQRTAASNRVGGAAPSDVLIEQTAAQHGAAAAPTAPSPIGRVERIAGTVTVQHANGAVTQLSVGDQILQGDVVQTGDGSALSVSLNDGTAYDVGADARVVLDGLIYDPDGDNMSAETHASVHVAQASPAINQPAENPSEDVQPQAHAIPHTDSPNPLLDTPLPPTEKLVSLLPFDELPSGEGIVPLKIAAEPSRPDYSSLQVPLSPPVTDFLFKAGNAAPSAVADVYVATLGHTLHVSAKGILGNDTDVNGAALSAILKLDTIDGLLVSRADGSFDYQPYFYGTTTFTYVANDGVTDSNPATVTINVLQGPDTFDISHATSNTLVLLDTATGIAFNSDFGLLRLAGVNHVIGGLGNDTIVGNNNAGVLNGGAGNDIIQGGSGNDVLIGAAGNDHLTGGGGADTFVFRPGFGHDTVMDLSLTDDALDLRGLGFTSVSDILNHTDAGPNAVIHAGADDITLMGVDKAALAAHAFDIFGGSSYGYSSSAGLDTLSNSDVLVINVGGLSGARDDTYSATLGQSLHVAAATGTVFDFSNGLSHSAVITGVLANDNGFNGGSATARLNSNTTDGLLSLHSDGSFDFLPYFFGTTTFTYIANNGVTDSNAATVTINVAKGTDTLDVSQATSNTLVMLDTSSGIAFNSELGLLRLAGVNHVIGGLGNDTIIGNNNGGVLNGGAGNDIIQGGSGSDILIGATGNDNLTGGAGDDIFVFRLGFGHDTVNDFSLGDPAHHDTLDLRGLGFVSVLDILNHTDAGPNAVIHVGGDDITLLGIDKALLAAHQSALLV